MVRDCMVVMQEFGVNVMCPRYNARKYEKQEEREERRRKPTAESERYYILPSIQSDFDWCKQGKGRLTGQWSDA